MYSYAEGSLAAQMALPGELLDPLLHLTCNLKGFVNVPGIIEAI